MQQRDRFHSNGRAASRSWTEAAVITTASTRPAVSTAMCRLRIPATFVYAGIDVERNGLLSGTRGEQIAGRFGMIRTAAFPRGEYWTGLISALEDSLRLHRHQPGALAGLEEYLHRRTGGMIGSLLRLIRGAAIQAVLDGTEEITRTALDSIGVDIASETAGTGRHRPGASRGDT